MNADEYLRKYESALNQRLVALQQASRESLNALFLQQIDALKKKLDGNLTGCVRMYKTRMAQIATERKKNPGLGNLWDAEERFARSNFETMTGAYEDLFRTTVEGIKRDLN